MAAVQHFSTEGRRVDGPDLFQEQMARLFSVGLAISSPEKPFHTQVTAYCGRHLRFAALRFSPHSTSSAHSGQMSSRLIVTLQKEGVAVVQQEGRENRIEAGDMFMIDPSRPFCIQTGELLTHSIYLEREVLRGVMPEVEGLTARPIKGGDGPGALFRGMVDEMFGLVDHLQEDTADRIADALPYVLTAALTSLTPAAAMTPSRLKLLHKQRILRFVRENLAHHELDAALIARSVNLSTRYVYELFEDEPQPLMKWIWGQRLERCHVELGSSALGARSIGEIAYRWGFNDLAHFSRAFRQRYGLAPRDFRAQQRRAAAAAEG
jgi:AraC-like DNA-binding protein